MSNIKNTDSVQSPALQSAWQVCWNIPGCLPETAPARFWSWQEAREDLEQVLEALQEEALLEEESKDLDLILEGLEALQENSECQFDFGVYCYSLERIVPSVWHAEALDLLLADSTPDQARGIVEQVQTNPYWHGREFAQCADLLLAIAQPDEDTGDTEVPSVDLGSAFLSGDYCGNGALAIANRKVLLEEVEGLEQEGLLEERTGDFGSAWIRCAAVLFRSLDEFEWEALARLVGYQADESLDETAGETLARDAARLVELTEGVQDYPCLDDDALWQAEQERQEEAWQAYAANDFAEAIQKRLGLQDRPEWEDTELQEALQESEQRAPYSAWSDEQGSACLDAEAAASRLDEEELQHLLARAYDAARDQADEKTARLYLSCLLPGEVEQDQEDLLVQALLEQRLVGPGRWHFRGVYLSELSGNVRLLFSEQGREEKGAPARFQKSGLFRLEVRPDHADQVLAFEPGEQQ